MHKRFAGLKTGSAVLAVAAIIAAGCILGLAALVPDQGGRQAEAGVGGASEKQISREHEKATLVTSIAQLAEPLSKIVAGCDAIAGVGSLLGSGTDPHLYQLTRADVVRLRDADMIFYVGHRLEAQMEELLHSLERTKPVYALAEELPSTLLLKVASHTYDPHLWMDPLLWKDVLAVASGKIADRFPECRAQIEVGAGNYEKRLEALDARILRLFAAVPLQQRILVTSHDAFGYFGRRYDLEVMALQGISTDRQISVGQVDALVEQLIAKKVRAVFTESSVSRRDMRAVIEGAAERGWPLRIGGTLFSDAMGAEGTETATYIGMLAHNVGLIANSLDKKFTLIKTDTVWAND